MSSQASYPYPSSSSTRTSTTDHTGTGTPKPNLTTTTTTSSSHAHAQSTPTPTPVPTPTPPPSTASKRSPAWKSARTVISLGSGTFRVLSVLILLGVRITRITGTTLYVVGKGIVGVGSCLIGTGGGDIREFEGEVGGGCDEQEDDEQEEGDDVTSHGSEWGLPTSCWQDWDQSRSVNGS